MQDETTPAQIRSITSTNNKTENETMESTAMKTTSASEWKAVMPKDSSFHSEYDDYSTDGSFQTAPNKSFSVADTDDLYERNHSTIGIEQEEADSEQNIVGSTANDDDRGLGGDDDNDDDNNFMSCRDLSDFGQLDDLQPKMKDIDNDHKEQKQKPENSSKVGDTSKRQVLPLTTTEPDADDNLNDAPNANADENGNGNDPLWRPKTPTSKSQTPLVSLSLSTSPPTDTRTASDATSTTAPIHSIGVVQDSNYNLNRPELTISPLGPTTPHRGAGSSLIVQNTSSLSNVSSPLPPPPLTNSTATREGTDILLPLQHERGVSNLTHQTNSHHHSHLHNHRHHHFLDCTPREEEEIRLHTNTAFIWIEPEYNTQAVQDMVRSVFYREETCHCFIEQEYSIDRRSYDYFTEGMLYNNNDDDGGENDENMKEYVATKGSHAFVVSWDERAFSWKQFRHSIIGYNHDLTGNDISGYSDVKYNSPMKAQENSLRRLIYEQQQQQQPSISTKSNPKIIHCSASPLEALLERKKWLNKENLGEDEFYGNLLLRKGIPESVVLRWLDNVRIPISVYDDGNCSDHGSIGGSSSLPLPSLPRDASKSNRSSTKEFRKNTKTTTMTAATTTAPTKVGYQMKFIFDVVRGMDTSECTKILLDVYDEELFAGAKSTVKIDSGGCIGCTCVLS